MFDKTQTAWVHIIHTPKVLSFQSSDCETKRGNVLKTYDRSYTEIGKEKQCNRYETKTV